MTKYLVRHGAPEQNPEGRRYIGVTDIPLSDEGRRQAADLGVKLRESMDPDDIRLFTSPLIRCVETARIIADQLGCRDGKPAPVIIGGLHEIDLGSWEGRLISEVRESEPEEYEARGRDMWNYRTPGGESFAGAGRRFLKALEELTADNDGKNTLIIVTHAGVIRAGLSLIAGEDFGALLKRDIPYAELIKL